ncbi:MAG: NYN domain-containing protein [Candidatus Omnitrophica bacterium]|nr:NYN domain-containing protein [Candidatus Omnitrophota bacterium]
MLVYIIDGYNLTHRVKSLKSSSTPQKDLVHYIEKNRLTGSKNNKVIIVFDGGLEIDVRQQSGSFNVFGSGEVSADDVIRRKVSTIRTKGEVVVVTDDRALRDSVRGPKVKLCRIADFIKLKSKDVPEADKDINYTLQHEITEEMRKIWLDE